LLKLNEIIYIPYYNTIILAPLTQGKSMQTFQNLKKSNTLHYASIASYESHTNDRAQIIQTQRLRISFLY
jgi:hypothetical protein